MLLHPGVDDPAEHLELDATGLVFGKTGRGRGTVEMLGLNERNLAESRRREIDDMLAVCATLVSDLIRHRRDEGVERAQRRVQYALMGKSEFSMAGRFAVSQARTATAEFG